MLFFFHEGIATAGPGAPDLQAAQQLGVKYSKAGCHHPQGCLVKSGDTDLEALCCGVLEGRLCCWKSCPT